MANLEVVLDVSGVRELLRSPEMLKICEERANHALNSLGDGYKVTSKTGKNRVNSSIFAETYQAKKENLENNSILKALR